MAYTTKFPTWPLLSLSADWHDCRGWVRHTSQHDRASTFACEAISNYLIMHVDGIKIQGVAKPNTGSQ